ncbi:CHASE3 domain-containing protein [Bdellovibrio sp. HCB185ZH]|uniref:CHASE3 domain-containing protein n=1 Tax=Bdellovibrio sp. HCB185ZH TaxID=3394235 RepID=UPI0039A52256
MALILVGAGVFQQAKLSMVAELSARRTQIRKISFDFKNLKSLVTDAETGQRGYLLTGNKRYLQPYYAARGAIPVQIEELEFLLRNDFPQVARLNQVKQLVDEKISEIKETVDLKRRGESEQALEIMNSNEGQASMEKLRLIFDEMEAFQLAQIATLTGSVTQTIRKSRLINLVSTGFAVLLAFILIYFLSRNIQASSTTNNSLTNSNNSLQKTKDLLTEVITIQNDIASSSLDMKSMLSKVVKLSMHLTRSDGAIIEELDLESGDLIYKHAAGAAVMYLGMRVQSRSSFSGLCIREGRPLICHDSEEDARVDREACRRVHARSMIVVPLYYGDKLLGVLKNYSDRPHFYSEEAFEALTLVSRMLSSSLGQAKEIEETKNQLNSLRSANRENHRSV